MNTVKIQNGLQAGLQAAGVDPVALLRKSGLPLTLWSSGRGIVTTEQGFAFWRAIGELSNDPGIGLKLPGLIPKEQHHPVMIAAQHARTFRDALQRFARYKFLICGEEMRLTESKEECLVEFTRLLSREFAPPLLVDAVFACALEIGRRGTGQPLHPLRVELKRNPAHREIHEAHYGCRVKFKAPRNAIVFRIADLDRPFVSYNAELLAMLGGQLERELAERTVWQTTVAARVKWILLRLLGGQSADLGEVAKDLGMSNRTLQRRITSEGTSFRRLVRDARHELGSTIFWIRRSIWPRQLVYSDTKTRIRSFAPFANGRVLHQASGGPRSAGGLSKMSRAVWPDQSVNSQLEQCSCSFAVLSPPGPLVLTIDSGAFGDEYHF